MRCFIVSSVRLAVALLVPLWMTADAVVLAQFTDVTASSGISYTQNHPTDMAPHVMSGGAAAGDFDGDGNVDLFVTRLDNTSILYRNQGNGTFVDISSSVSGIGSIQNGNGGSWGDIDNDGDSLTPLRRGSAI
jgi:hypothetical protein